MEDEVRDVVVVGGGAAGLSAGLMLAGARRRVTAVDAGAPGCGAAGGGDGRVARGGAGRAARAAGGGGPSADEQVKLAAVGMPVISGRVTRLEAGGEHALGVCLDDGRVVEVDVVAVASRMVARAAAFSGIGIETAEHPMGSYIAAD